jgi:SAM-dependent methyltransferase
MNDPLEGTPWSEAGTVAGFVQSAPNATLIRFAAAERSAGGRRLLDIGCGAGRNAVPLSQQGWTVTAVDLSWPMLRAAAGRAQPESPRRAPGLVLAPMELLPVQSATMDFVVAHGIWNLARSTAQFRAAVREAARVSRPGAALFVFTFSRSTLPPQAVPVPGEAFVFTEFSGAPQCFLTAEQLTEELAGEGFVQDRSTALIEHNRPPAGTLRFGGSPVIHEGIFRYQPACHLFGAGDSL